jgi:hypothetical protein
MSTVNIERVPIDEVWPDPDNPRESDDARLHILGLSLSKLGWVLPCYIDASGRILSGHQRHYLSKRAGLESIPCVRLDLDARRRRGVNVLFNRTTNDFGALDTGRAVSDRLPEVVEEAAQLPDFVGEDFYAYSCAEESIAGLAQGNDSRYDRKGLVAARQLAKLGIDIPLVVTESGEVVNGIFRLFEARASGREHFPVVRIPDTQGRVAGHFLNYLSMDYKVDEQFGDLLRYSAYRRPQNNRGRVPKAYRFWANGERTLLDRDSYSASYWRTFRDLHGLRLLDFGSGLSKAAPYLRTKGFEALDFEPYRVNTEVSGVPDIGLSKSRARSFLEEVSDPERRFDSIFLASVLAIVHALSNFDTTIYGTCRDVSDFHYEYQGIRQASYFVFDSEPQVRLGDSLSNPKIQKFYSEEETAELIGNLWNTVETWPGGNVHYWRAKNPKRVSPTVLRAALEFEFDLPYADGTTMGLVEEALEAFSCRLGVQL